MIHPIFKRIVTNPGLFAEHAASYAELVKAEARQVGSRWASQAVYGAVAAGTGLLGIGLAGVSMMLAGALPHDPMPASWVLWVVPGVPLVTAGVCAWLMKRSAAQEAFSELRQQWQQDVRVFQEAAPT